jgi:hypothetical protein
MSLDLVQSIPSIRYSIDVIQDEARQLVERGMG